MANEQEVRPTTPGRPTESGSRQQRQGNESSQAVDPDRSDKSPGTNPPAPIPPGPK